jgi:hypothetical protein
LKSDPTWLKLSILRACKTVNCGFGGEICGSGALI